MYLASASSWGGAGDLSRAGRIFTAHYSVTGLSAFSATTANPLLYNGSASSQSKVLAVLLGLGVGWTTAPGASGTVGIGIGTTAAPTSTSAVTAVANTNPFGPAPNCLALNAGTVTAATGFIATHEVSTGATSQPACSCWVPLEGLVTLPPGAFVNVSGAAAIATMVAKISLVWAEISI